MKCKICGQETKDEMVCSDCRAEIDILTDEMVSFKRKINLNFDQHHYVRT